MNHFILIASLLLLFLLNNFIVEARQIAKSTTTGTRWVVLVAGSNYYENYRHQADVCHAYQILKNGGLKDENIIVFMYDDIAFNVQNPRPGIIINKPYGPDDYTGENCTANNFLAVILGNRTALTGGSGKVVNSGPNDYIFIYYADHGSAACESGSMFDGLLTEDMNIYAVTASTPAESSYAMYCPGHYPSPEDDFETCLGGLFSISWIEDSEKHDLQKETLQQQHGVVRRRTLVDYLDFSSHVMQYGNKELSKEPIFTYIGTNPDNDNFTMKAEEFSSNPSAEIAHSSRLTRGAVSQRDAQLHYLWHRFNRSADGSSEKIEAQKQLQNEILSRQQVDQNIHQIIAQVFGEENVSKMIESIRPAGQPLVDDWDCLKMLVRIYGKICGSLSIYGKKYTRAMANMCNAGINEKQMTLASNQACLK
ncbi:vacuolar-processing enzyme alpha-isozyme [Citrus sinensis]|nr:vacuolar-processing enzyme alpha-isozyme [Citrus sinensis]